ncbi:MAG: hypothetical protein ACI9YT_000392, partial [Halobacteriales archaeon]
PIAPRQGFDPLEDYSAASTVATFQSPTAH